MKKGKIQQVYVKTEFFFIRFINWRIIRGRLLMLLRFYLSMLISGNKLFEIFPSHSVFHSLPSSLKHYTLSGKCGDLSDI